MPYFIEQLKQQAMNNLHKPTEASLASGTIKFHLKAAKALDQYGRKADAKTALKNAEIMHKRLEKLEK